MAVSSLRVFFYTAVSTSEFGALFPRGVTMSKRMMIGIVLGVLVTLGLLWWSAASSVPANFQLQ